MTLTEGQQSNLDTLPDEEIQRIKYNLWSTEEGVVPEMIEAPTAKPLLVAEGDSWFDYAPGLDILDHLRSMGYPIIKVAEAGDTLDNMVYGTQYSRNFSRKEPPLEKTLRLKITWNRHMRASSFGR